MNNYLKLFFFLLFSFFTFSGIANTTSSIDSLTKDSLLNNIELATQDSIKVEAMIDYARFLMKDLSNSDEVLDYYEEAASIALKANYKLGVLRIYNLHSRMLIDLDDLEVMYDKLIAVMSEMERFNQKEAKSIVNNAIVFRSRKKYDLAFKLLHEVDEKLKKDDEYYDTVFLLAFMKSEIFVLLDDLERAEDYAHLSIDYAKKTRKKENIDAAQISLYSVYDKRQNYNKALQLLLRLERDTSIDKRLQANIYKGIVKNKIALNQSENALVYAQLYFSIAKTSRDSILAYLMLADSYNALNLLEDAVAQHKAIDSILEREPSLDAIKKSSLSKAKTLLRLKRYDEIVNILNEALPIYQQYKETSSEKYSEFLRLMITAHEGLNNLPEAYHYQKELLANQDTLILKKEGLHGYRVAANFQELEMKAEQNILNEKNTQQRNLLYLLGGLSFLLLLLGGIVFRQAKTVAREKKKSETLLGNILPLSIAQRMKAGENSIVDYFDEATVVFIDMVGFTRFSNQAKPQEVAQLLNLVFGKLDALTEQFQLEKIKTIGDCYMAVAGIPIPEKEHLENTIRFCLTVIDQLDGLEFHGHKISFKIGIETGEVVAGIIGEKRFLFDLWGDTVNTASRMESNGVASRIMTTKRVYLKMKNHFLFEYGGSIDIKGKGKMDVYLLENHK